MDDSFLIGKWCKKTPEIDAKIQEFKLAMMYNDKEAVKRLDNEIAALLEQSPTFYGLPDEATEYFNMCEELGITP